MSQGRAVVDRARNGRRRHRNTLVLQDERIRVRTLFYTVQAEYLDVLQSWERSGKRFGRVDGQLLLPALRPAFQLEIADTVGPMMQQ